MGDVIGVALTSIFCVAFFATAGYCYNQDDGTGGGIWLGSYSQPRLLAASSWIAISLSMHSMSPAR